MSMSGRFAVVRRAAMVAFVALAGWGLADGAAARAADEPPAAAPAAAAGAEAERQAVWQTEEAFAAAFAARDPERFASFLDDHAVFSGSDRELRGKAEVREAWTRMMLAGPAAPFSWRPSRVLVNGDVAMSSGQVLDTAGNWVGAFTSVWRRQADGSWRIVLDGAAPCQQRPAPPAAAATPAPTPAPPAS